MKKSNDLHSQLRKILMIERDKVVQGVNLYYESLGVEIDNNFQRKNMWMQEINEHYQHVRTEMISLQQKLQS